MCTSNNCSYKSSCLRTDNSKANPQYQSYCNFEYECNGITGFPNFILNENKDNKKGE